jgi:hypothetical protein
LDARKFAGLKAVEISFSKFLGDKARLSGSETKPVQEVDPAPSASLSQRRSAILVRGTYCGQGIAL